MQRSRPVAVAFGSIAAVQAFLATAGAADWLTEQQISIINGLIAAATVFLSVYLSGTNMETRNVAVAMVGEMPVAGPGSHRDIPDGTVLRPNRTIEEVVPPPARDDPPAP